jgi:hypothetical protein
VLNPPALPPPGATKVHVYNRNLVQTYVLDMSDNAKEAAIAEWQSKALVAEATSATPARQESVRVATVVGGMLTVLVLGHCLKLSENIVLAALGVIGGTYVVPKAIEKWKGSKALAPTP